MQPDTRRHEAIADRLCDLVAELTRHRVGRGPHWLMVSTLHDALARHGVDVSTADLDAAIAIAVERCVLKTAGTPPHSIAAWQKDWQLKGPV